MADSEEVNEMRDMGRFDAFGSGVLRAHSFDLVRQYEDDRAPGVALDYRNSQLGLRLLWDHYGSDIFVTPPQDIEERYNLEDVLHYLVGQPASSWTLADLARLFEMNYERIVRLFSREPDSGWRDFREWLEALNRRRFHFDKVGDD
jgi:hypothetical protein